MNKPKPFNNLFETDEDAAKTLSFKNKADGPFFEKSRSDIKTASEIKGFTLKNRSNRNFK